MTNDIYTLYNIDKSKLKRDYLENPLKKEQLINTNCGYYKLENPHKEDLEYLINELQLRKSYITKIFNWSRTSLCKWLDYYDIETIDDRLKPIIKIKDEKNPNNYKNIYEYLGITPKDYTFKRDYIKEPLKKNIIRNSGGLEYEKVDYGDMKYLYIDLGLSNYEICKIVGHKIQYYLCQTFDKQKSRKIPKLSKDELYDKLYVKNIPMIDIAKSFGYSSISPIKSWCKYYDIKIKSSRYLNNKLDLDILKDMYIVQNKSIRTIAKEFNSTKKTITNLLKENNISKDIKKQQLSRFYSNHTPLQIKLLLNRNEFEKYIIEHNINSKEELSEHSGLKYSTLTKYIRIFGLKKYFSRRKNSSECKWLDSIGIPNDDLHRQVKIDKYIVDGYDPNTNTIYEFLGDYWHGNPNMFNPDEVNTTLGLTFGELYQRTFNRLKEIESLGYNIVYVWENRIKKGK